MSLPLKRRMARAALLVAAAAPVIGMGATTASAAALPQTADLGGLSHTDAASHLGGTLDSTTHRTVGSAGGTLDSAGRTIKPAAQKTVGGAAGQVGRTVGHGTGAVQGGQGLTHLPPAGLQTGGIPPKGLPTI